MSMQLRIARPVSNLSESVRLYTQGLGLAQLSQFADHDGFDGVILGYPGESYQIELTYCRHHPIAPSPTIEDLLVFAVSETDWQLRIDAMHDAGFIAADAFNPYWARQGITFVDADGYRVVIRRG